ncbi:hypothetical protein SBOR_2690 [Sclerotinia borealis F-4128]|uniref:Uncharacterized protein n=1 Tax=Sclerotinia borealis (strain F-4128) TaxID=1432307 RepID=W9CM54_SCLBF|nr:hypothetical protein SBOR_2690 [Sclerotinia borealis F-4128]
MSSRFWTNTPLSAEERARRRNLSNEERQAEAKAAREAYDRAQSNEESWYQPRKEPKDSEFRRRQAATPEPSATCGNPAFFGGAPEQKSAKKMKQEQKAKIRERRRESRREAEKAAAKESKRLADMNQWDYAKMWQRRDREAYGSAFDDFSTSAADFIKDNTKPFPKLKKHGCERNNCVNGNVLGVCHHEVEATLRGSGCFDEKSVKKERLRWHPDRWTGKGQLQVMSNELFQLIQRIVDGDENANANASRSHE